jgi:hypothetical protein
MKTLLVSIGLGALMSTAALAAPATGSAPAAAVPETLQQNSVIQIQHRRDDDRRWREQSRRHRYEPGRHYRSAPHGWHRHRHRPRDWYARGCVVIGPVWFCP